MTASPDPYLHGHHESVLRSHSWRSVENSAAYLLPHLESGQRLLDIGCGPGTITIDLASRVAPGDVLGIDASPEVVIQAGTLLESTGAPGNCRFESGNVYNLDMADESFDVVHAHQVLQHLTDPVGALREVHRVLAPGGIMAIRDADYGAMAWAPLDRALDRWNELYHAMADEHGTEPNAGRFLTGWARSAGFDTVESGSSTWTFATPEAREWWGGLWADRVRHSSFAEHALSMGLSTREELDQIASAWQRWAHHPDGWFMCPHGELIARR